MIHGQATTPKPTPMVPNFTHETPLIRTAEEIFSGPVAAVARDVVEDRSEFVAEAAVKAAVKDVFEDIIEEVVEDVEEEHTNAGWKSFRWNEVVMQYHSPSNPAQAEPTAISSTVRLMRRGLAMESTFSRANGEGETSVVTAVGVAAEMGPASVRRRMITHMASAANLSAFSRTENDREMCPEWRMGAGSLVFLTKVVMMGEAGC
ncbi:hypothetical protein VP1G_10642 [Cytospora mali]|uniref:Uncharacterized protein n=1 Tax=Cytospora mali TaxID=578113 RepID=A0A194USZ7_CYTMA|nr:hypothetical protein VP1G_10642 [Valsa mali var. pyri (nom. inval.)]